MGRHPKPFTTADIGRVLGFAVRSKLQFIAVTAKADIVWKVDLDCQINAMSTNRTLGFRCSFNSAAYSVAISPKPAHKSTLKISGTSTFEKCR